jgi:N-acetylneuraminate synthase
MSAFGEKIFILDLANNHFGDVPHALKVIDALEKAVSDLGQKVVLKLQLRDLETYIHPDYQARTDLHYIKRFSETRLQAEDFRVIAHAAKRAGFLTMATTFDEPSCETFSDIGFDFVKIASASSNDNGLVRAAANLGAPLVASTGGLSEFEIQDLHALLESTRQDFAIMHCVSVYPAPDEILQLAQVQNFRTLFPQTPIGWSTHESPENFTAVGIALALGATLFERHVGLPTAQYKLNAYSSSPEQVRKWISSAIGAEKMIGAVERLPSSRDEVASLKSLKRGYFVKTDVEAGEQIDETKVFAAFPLADGGLESGAVHFPVVLRKDLPSGSAILKGDVESPESIRLELQKLLNLVRSMLARSGVKVNADAKLELSHHYGLSRFREHGVAMFTCINRNYAKKILVMLPRQKHPMHYHDIKEETFQLLWGDAQITINGKRLNLNPGDVATVYPKEWHKFSTLNGCVIEEVSTHHSPGDSYYEDKAISAMDLSSRKTSVQL